MELRLRSRSKTPFSTAEMEQQNFITTRSRKSARVTSTVTTAKSAKKSMEKLIRTSDYSSEDGEDFNVKHITENDKNQLIEDARKAANGNNEVSALKLYQYAERYWDKYPKTDWTYSLHSRDRVELAPGVVAMPNMSRRTIHSSDKFTNTEESNEFLNEDFECHSFESRQSNDYEIRRKLFTTTRNNNLDSTDGYYYNNKFTTKTTTTTSIKIRVQQFFIRILTIFTTIFYYFYNKQHSAVLWLGKKVHLLTSRIMLLDTWLMRKRNTNKNLKGILLLCLLPLLLFGGVHVLLANGVPLAPSCHPHCGRYISTYFNSLIKNTISG